MANIKKINIKGTEYEIHASKALSLSSGTGENSIQQETSLAISENTLSFGKNNIAGLKGYYIAGTLSEEVKTLANGFEYQELASGGIDFSDFWSDEVLEFSLSDIELSTPSNNFVIPTTWRTGDTVTIFWGRNYYYCGTILKISGAKVTVQLTAPVDSRWNSDYNDSSYIIGTDKATGVFNMDRQEEGGPIDGGTSCTVFGSDNSSLAYNSFVTGGENIGYGKYCGVFGRANEGGYATLVAGKNNKAKADYSGATGQGNVVEAAGINTYIFGLRNSATARDSLIIGRDNIGTGTTNCGCVFVSGEKNTVSSYRGFAHGYNLRVTGMNSVALGAGNGNTINITHQVGTNSIGFTNIIKTSSHTSGVVTGSEAFSSGAHNSVSGTGAGTIGFYNHVVGEHSVVTGQYNNVNTKDSLVSGQYNYVSGGNGMQVVVGNCNYLLDSEGSAVFGSYNYAANAFVTVGGKWNKVTHTRSSAFGEGLKSSHTYQTVLGKYNFGYADSLFEIGNGASNTDRKTVLYITETGKLNASGGLVTSGDLSAVGDIHTDGSLSAGSASITGVCGALNLSAKTVETDTASFGQVTAGDLSASTMGISDALSCGNVLIQPDRIITPALEVLNKANSSYFIDDVIFENLVKQYGELNLRFNIASPDPSDADARYSHVNLEVEFPSGMCTAYPAPVGNCFGFNFRAPRRISLFVSAPTGSAIPPESISLQIDGGTFVNTGTKNMPINLDSPTWVEIIPYRPDIDINIFDGWYYIG